MKNIVLLPVVLAVVSCNPASSSKTAVSEPAAGTLADSLHQAVATYIRANTGAFPNYEAVRWGQPAPYTKMNEAAIKGVVAMQAFDDALVPRNQALAEYKASLARHDAAARVEAIKARYGKANKYNDSLLAIANGFIGSKDSTRLGTEIVHTYRVKNKSGATLLDSAAFVLFRNGKVERL